MQCCFLHLFNFFLSFFFFQLADNCFTVLLYRCQLHNKLNHAIYRHIPPPLLVSPRPPPQLQIITERGSGAPRAANSLRNSCLRHGRRAQMSGLLSRIVPPLLPRHIHRLILHLLSLSCPEMAHQYHFPKFHIRVCEWHTVFALLLRTSFLCSRQTLDPSTSLQWTQILFPLHSWVIFPLLLYQNFFIHSSLHGHEGRLHVLDTAKNTSLGCETKSRMLGWMNSRITRAGGKLLESHWSKSLVL